MKVEIEGGKYTYVFEPGGGSQVLRYGQPWRDVTGDKFIYCMAAEIEELRGKLKSAEFWSGVYPDGWTAERVANEMHDYNMLLDGMDMLYEHVTGGKATKPNTSKSVIMSLHDDHINEIVEDAVNDATIELKEQLAAAQATTSSCGRLLEHITIEELRGKLEKVKLECMGMRQGLINWRSKAWSGSDQQAVVDRDFPSIADLVKGS